MRAFVVRLSDIERCPIKSLSASHYRDNGTCLCTDKPPEKTAWFVKVNFVWSEVVVAVDALEACQLAVRRWREDHPSPTARVAELHAQRFQDWQREQRERDQGR